MNISIPQNRKIGELFFLILIILAAFWIRVDEYIEWQVEPEKYFYQGEPLLTTYDGYYYLTLARDLIEGTYDPIDTMRAVPDHPRRPSPPPLLSVLAASLTNILPFSLNWIGVTLPVLLGLLLAIPLYAFGRYWGGGVMALTAVMVGMLSSYYVSRSNLGWFDTDCMNVTFTLSISYCLMRFGLEKQFHRYYFFGAAAILTLLFLWWWDQAQMVVALIFLVPFSLALAFNFRPPAKEVKLFYSFLVLVAALVLFWGGLDFPMKMISSVWSKFLYISKQSSSDFPDIGVFVSEQSRLLFSELIDYSTGNWVTFFSGVLGFGLLGVKRPREIVYLAVPFVFGLCAYFFAQRFVIFFISILALGVGYFVSLIWTYFNRNSMVHVLIVFILLYFASSMHLQGTTRSPSVFGMMVSGMNKVDELTSENAVIWNWTNIGYPLIYWGRRSTISDGALHGGERVVYNAIPFVVSDYRLSANFIRFYVQRGMRGIKTFYKAVNNDKAKGLRLIKEILADGPVKAREIILAENISNISGMQSTEDWLEFFYPKKSEAIYLFLDWPLSNQLKTVYWFGTWDVDAKKGETLVSGVKLALGGRVDGNMLTTSSGLSADLARGVLMSGENSRELKTAAYTNKSKTTEYLYPGHEDGKYHLEMNIDADFSYVAYQDEKLGKTIFNKMYWRANLPPEQYFKPVYAQKPFYQIWRVGGDVYNEAR